MDKNSFVGSHKSLRQYKPSETTVLHKLSNVGASKSTVNWFRSYLTDRFQSTRINSTLSDPLPITYGVPQNSGVTAR
jgi:hypothetical protein